MKYGIQSVAASDVTQMVAGSWLLADFAGILQGLTLCQAALARGGQHWEFAAYRLNHHHPLPTSPTPTPNPIALSLAAALSCNLM
jgi:hypothetical protein